MNKSDLIAYAVALPKAELQLHIEGTLEPEMVLSLAQRNKIDIPYKTVDDVQIAYKASHPQQFFENHEQSQKVLRTEEDFFDLTMAYLNRACAHNVRHAEISFSPQKHISRGVTFNTVVGGILTALSLAKMQFGMTTSLIMNFSSPLSQDTTLDVLRQAEPWLEQLAGVCLSIENAENSPSKLAEFFEAVSDRNLKCMAQVDRDSAMAQINAASEQIHLDRIGHGIGVKMDDELIERVVREEIAIAVCPLSDKQLGLADTTGARLLKHMLDRDMLVTINSNAPAFLGGYMLDNFKAIIDASEMTFGEIKRLAKNSFSGSFLPEGQKRAQIAAVDLV